MAEFASAAPAPGASLENGPAWPEGAPPTLVAIEMGYGHLRPAFALSRYLSLPVLRADQPPLADEEEQANWARTRRAYEVVSRVSSTPVVGGPFRALLDSVTAIPKFHPFRDLSAPNLPVELLRYTASRGLGRALVRYLRDARSTLVATFYSPAIVADHHGYDRIWCVVTDSDVQRIWVPRDPRSTHIRYFAPTSRVVGRLRAYGVPKESIDFTGFPLPHSLLGGPELPVLRRNLAARLVRLDPRGVFRAQYARELEELDPLGSADGPPLLVFAVGGAGAQADMPAKFLPSLRPLIERGRLEVCLVAGVRKAVAELFEEQISECGLAAQLGRGVRILSTETTTEYFEEFERVLARADILWTKPSELTFYGALGLPLVFAPDVGRHEAYNRRWALENGAGLRQRDPRFASEWLGEWLTDGTLAAAAWAGHKRLPSRGLYRIADRLRDANPALHTTLVPPEP
jgi:hypothetical protein